MVYLWVYVLLRLESKEKTAIPSAIELHHFCPDLN